MAPAATVSIVAALCVATVVIASSARASSNDKASENPETVFEDSTYAAGIVASHRALLDERESLPTYLMTGQAWGDYNGDGLLDLYLTNQRRANNLYENLGNGRFEAAPVESDVELSDSASGGAVFVDYDNDGRQDLYVTAYGQDRLLHNDGDGFSDVTAEAGLSGDDKHGTTAAWGDYDGDGYLDLYVVNYGCQPCEAEPDDVVQDRLWHNNGDGTFTDMTDMLPPGSNAFGFAASWFDYDGDADADLYLVNDIRGTDFLPGNMLMRNDGPGCGGWCFSDVSETAGAATRVDGMGLAVGDYDNDGDFDLYFSSTGTRHSPLAGPSVLLASNADGTFADVSDAAGVAVDAITWAPLFVDYDNDGFEDLYVALGAMGTAPDPGGMENKLFHNNRDATFADVTSGSGAGNRGDTLGVASADYDDDGDVDFVIGNLGSRYLLYRNTGMAAAGNGVVKVRLTGSGPVSTDAAGAVVALTTTGRDEFGDAVAPVTQTKMIVIGSALGAGSDQTLVFGTGDSEITELAVTWPDGRVDTFSGEKVPVNSTWSLQYGESSPEVSGFGESAGTASETSSVFWIAVAAFCVIVAAVVVVVVITAARRRRAGQGSDSGPGPAGGPSPSGSGESTEGARDDADERPPAHV